MSFNVSSEEEEWNDAEYHLESSSDSSASSEEDVRQPTKQNSRNIVINDSDEGTSMLDTSMIYEIGDKPSVSDYPSYSLDESVERNEDDTDALFN